MISVRPPVFLLFSFILRELPFKEAVDPPMIYVSLSKDIRCDNSVRIRLSVSLTVECSRRFPIERENVKVL